MRRHVTRALLAGALFALPFTAAADDGRTRSDDAPRAGMKIEEPTKESLAGLIRTSTEVFKRLTAEKERLPRELMEKARCVAVFPEVKKGALIIGGHGGDGIASCKAGKEGKWSNVGFVNVAGGSVGFQAGVEKQDLVLFFMDEQSEQRLRSGKFTLGTDVHVTGGEFGKDFRGKEGTFSNIVAYSRSGGVFAGAAITGTMLTADDDAMSAFYANKDLSTALNTPANKDLSPAMKEFLDLLPA